MAVCLASGVDAQIYNSDVLFYVSQNANLANPETSVTILRYNEGICYHVCRYVKDRTIKKVWDNLRKNINYYEENTKIWVKLSGESIQNYDTEMSNAKWHVYSKYYPYIPAIDLTPRIESHRDYSAIKKDFSEYMTWSEPLYRFGDDLCGQRITLKRISKEELLKLTFTAARDFLQ